MTSPAASPVLLSDMAVVHIDGDDAESFLHGQLTNDVQTLEAGHARLAAYCTPKGRVLATLMLWKRDGTGHYAALVKADLAQALVKRLTMFVLRAKAKLGLLETPVCGFAYPTGQQPDFLPANAVRGTVVEHETGTYVAAPHTGQRQRWWHIPAGQPWPETNTGTEALQSWQADDIDQGLPWITTATQDLFIPQTLNLDLIEGVSFTKGCYPGQEVVARSHYRGTVKRRMACAIVASDVAAPANELPGQDIFNALASDTPCGRVINAARVGDQIHCLLEVQLSDLGQADFRLGEASGPALTVTAPPYPLEASH